MLVDFHAHLHYPDFQSDLEQVIEGAYHAGVTRILTAGTDMVSSEAARVVAERFPGVFFAAGFHPHDADQAKPGYLKELESLLGHPKCVAIGEIGLDFHYDRSPREIQERLFREELDLAKSLDKPVIIHSRLAEEQALEMTLACGLKRALFHCFTGKLDTGRAIQAAGFLIGVTGIVTFNNPSNAELVAGLDPEKLVTETDCPFLAPKPFRGKRCEPAHAALVLQKLAGLFPGWSAERLADNIRRHSDRFIFPV